MSLNLPELRLVVAQLDTCLQGAILRRAQEDANAPGDLIFELRTPGQNHWLRISTQHQLARIHRITERPPAPEKPAAFTMLLRSQLVGAQLSKTELVGDDRIVRLHFRHRDESRLRLVAELIGKDANVFLLNEGDQILGVASARTAAQRGLHVHGPWSAPPPPPQRPQQLRAGWPDQSDDLDRWLEESYSSRAAHLAYEALERSLRQSLKQALKRARRAKHAVEGDLEKADDAAELKHEADLLQSVRHQLARGAAEAHVADWLDEGRTRVIALDPSRALQDQIGDRYKTYKRMQNAADRILARLEELETRVARLEEGWSEFETLQNAAELNALKTRLERQGLLKAQRAQRKSRGDREPAKPYKVAHSTDGFTILVGRSARDNDTLTIQVARGRDLWLHARDVAGSHVIIRRDKNQDVPFSTILEAANLAACYSKSRHDTNVEIGYTERKHVSKPKGLGPGQVHVAAMKTVLVTPDPEAARASFERSAAGEDSSSSST